MLTVCVLAVGSPGGSDGKESACNVGDLGLNPGLGRSHKEGHVVCKTAKKTQMCITDFWTQRERERVG